MIHHCRIPLAGEIEWNRQSKALLLHENAWPHLCDECAQSTQYAHHVAVHRDDGYVCARVRESPESHLYVRVHDRHHPYADVCDRDQNLRACLL